MDVVDQAILRTLLYADVFNFPMTAREIHHFLIHDRPVSRADVEAHLASSVALRPQIVAAAGYYALQGRDAIIEVRCERAQAAQSLSATARVWAAWMARLPFVRMVALTGALAMHNPLDANDDIDYLLITAPGRVWLARALSIVLVRVAKLCGVVLCPNYVLAESALEQNRRDLFIAHEVTQMTPLYGQEVWQRMRAVNDWALEQLPNADGVFNAFEAVEPGQRWGVVKRGFETVLGGKFGDWLESWEQRRKVRRFAVEAKTPHSASQLDGEHVKGHFNDHGHRVLGNYAERLRNYGLDAETQANRLRLSAD